MSGRAGCKWGLAVIGAMVVGLGMAEAGNALERLDFAVRGASAALDKELRFASILLASQKAGTVDAQDLFADARAEYASLLGALYASGHYSPVIHVMIDGREAAGIAPLDAPARIGRIEVQVDP